MEEKEKIDTLIISDIHLGSSLSRPDKLIEVLEKYNFDKLIVNGDTFDGYNFKRLNSQHWEVLSYLRKISKVKKVIWVNGNHDGDADLLSQLIGVEVHNSYQWEINGKKYLAIHGEMFDRFSSKNAILSMIFVSIYQIIKRMDKRNPIVSNWLINTSYKWLKYSKQVARGAIHYAKIRKVDYIFCGHTHVTMHLEEDNINYYNSGSFTDKTCHYIIIKNGQPEIK